MDESDFDWENYVDESDYVDGSLAQVFVHEVEQAGFDAEHYHGYSYHQGPAVRVDNEAELVRLIRATTGPVEWDTLGMGWIVYVYGKKVGE